MEKLEQTIDIVKQILQDENLVLKRLYNDFIDEREELLIIAVRKKHHISNLKVSKLLENHLKKYSKTIN